MTDTKSGGPGKFKCPKCGSTDIARTVSKPPRNICKKCGCEFD